MLSLLARKREEHGYVERVPDPSDRRATLVQATQRGAEVFAIARAYMTETERLLRRRLGAARVEELREALRELDGVLADRR